MTQLPEMPESGDDDSKAPGTPATSAAGFGTTSATPTSDTTPKPPPPMPTPPVAPPPPPKKQGGWRGCLLIGCAVVVALPVLGLVMMMFIGMIGGAGMAAGGQNNQVMEQIVEQGDSTNKIVVLDVSGILFGGKPQPFAPPPLTTRLLRDLDAIEKDENVVAVVLDMNTPGGEVTATDEVYHKIQQLRKERGIKFITCMRTLAASGGYYLAAGTDHIVANRLSLTGSIGVVMGGVNLSELLNEHGVKSEVYTSGRYKDMLNMMREREEYEREYIQGMVDDMFDEFAQIVAEGRNLDVETVRSFEAKIFTGKQALELKLVDELGYLDDAMASARRLSGDSNATIVRYQAFPSLGNLFFGAQSRETGMDALARRLAPRTQRGVPYYLMPLAE